MAKSVLLSLFVSLYACLSVRNITEDTYESILMKSSG